MRSPEQIIIVSGAQQAVDLCSRVLLDPGDPVWVEDPGYHGAQAALSGIGAKLTPVPVDESGLMVSADIATEPQRQGRLYYPIAPVPNRGRDVDATLARHSRLGKRSRRLDH